MLMEVRRTRHKGREQRGAWHLYSVLKESQGSKLPRTIVSVTSNKGSYPLWFGCKNGPHIVNPKRVSLSSPIKNKYTLKYKLKKVCTWIQMTHIHIQREICRWQRTCTCGNAEPRWQHQWGRVTPFHNLHGNNGKLQLLSQCSLFVTYCTKYIYLKCE